MIDKLKEWLLSRRDGKGGFLQSSEALDSFGRAPYDVTNAYIVWSLTSAKLTDIDQEITYLINLAKTVGGKDPYLLSLIAASLYNINKTEEA